MKIGTEQYNISMQGCARWDAFKRYTMQKILDCTPECTAKESDKLVQRWKNINDRISRPTENRLILGATAGTQVIIDANNKKVDEDTRFVSACKTGSKIVVGTATGILVRGIVYWLIGKLTNTNGNSKLSKILLPKKYIDELAKNKIFLSNYRSTIAMLAALIVLSYTNLKMDAPWTMKCTNWAVDTFKENKETQNNQLQIEEGGLNE